MAFRSMGVLHVQSTSVPQPLVGSWISAGIGAATRTPITITLGTISGASATSDAQVIFKQGDPVWLLDPNGANGEPAVISSVNAGANQVTLSPQTTHMSETMGGCNPVTTRPHISGGFGTGTWIILAMSVNNLLVQTEDGTAGAYTYLGVSYNMTATYNRVFKLPKVLAGQNPFYWNASESFGGNPFNVSELWVLGGSGNSLDGYTPSFCIL